jgi:gluconate 2-dehydrogenase gamma chain
MFMRNVTEGLFCDPMHGGNRDMVGWKWVGFPGDPTAYGEPYARHVDKWNQPYRVAPKGIQ